MSRLIDCPDCKEPVSDAAPYCPHCGRPIAAGETRSPLKTEDAERRPAGVDVSTLTKAPIALSQRSIGLAGVIILFVGVFLPIIHIPVAGDVNYFGNGQGDGIFLLLAAALSLLTILRKRYFWLLPLGIGSASLLLFTLFSLLSKLHEARADMEAKLSDNPFKGIAEAAVSSISLQWGWAVLFIGAFALIVSGAIGARAEAVPRHFWKIAVPVTALLVLAIVVPWLMFGDVSLFYSMVWSTLFEGNK